MIATALMNLTIAETLINLKQKNTLEGNQISRIVLTLCNYNWFLD